MLHVVQSPPLTGMPDDSARLATLRSDVATRLRKICEAMPQNEFDQLVDRIAQLAYKYEQIRDLFPPPPPSRQP